MTFWIRPAEKWKEEKHRQLKSIPHKSNTLLASVADKRFSVGRSMSWGSEGHFDLHLFWEICIYFDRPRQPNGRQWLMTSHYLQHCWPLLALIAPRLNYIVFCAMALKGPAWCVCLWELNYVDLKKMSIRAGFEGVDVNSGEV